MKNKHDVILKSLCSGSRCINKAEVLSCGRPQGSGRQIGFTLVELLVVVLIIGVLSAIAIPMYQGAVDKSHWSTMLPASKAIKDAEEAFKMTNGEYSDTMEHLDVQMNNADLTFDLQTPNTLSQPNVIRVTNSKLGDKVRLASYLDDSPLFAGQLHCEANDGPNGRGTRLCEKLLQGQYLKTTDDGYTRYLLDQEIDKATCGNANLVWSNKQTNCYKTEQERCTANKFPYKNGVCGYSNTEGEGKTVEDGATCIASGNRGCWISQVKDGGKCLAQVYDGCKAATIYEGGVCEVSKSSPGRACENIHVKQGGVCIDYRGDGCNGTVEGGIVICEGVYCGGGSYDGGICVANTADTCWSSHFTNGSICYGNAKNNTCDSAVYAGASYDETSCCCGSYCGSAPKCSATRCTEAIAPYQQYLN